MDEAKNVGQTAAQAGTQVASVATDQAKEVVQETQRQAKDLLDQGRSQLKEQAVTQQQKAGQSLTSLAQELRGLADGTSAGAPGPARDLLQQASSSVENFAAMLQNRDPGELLDEVRRFARRKPGVFLLGAAAAGVLAGRLTSGVKAAHSDTTPSGGYTARTNYVDPAPTYSGLRGDVGLPGDPGIHHDGHVHRHRHPRPAPPRPAAAPAVRDGSARGQHRAAGEPGRLGRPDPASRWGGLTHEHPLLRSLRGRPSPGLCRSPPAPPTPQNYASDYSGNIETPTTEEGRPDVEGTSVGELMGEVAKDLSTLMRQELELAKVEVKAEAKKAGTGAGLFGAAGFAGYMVLMFLSIALWWALSHLVGATAGRR